MSVLCYNRNEFTFTRIMYFILSAIAFLLSRTKIVSLSLFSCVIFFSSFPQRIFLLFYFILIR